MDRLAFTNNCFDRYFFMETLDEQQKILDFYMRKYSFFFSLQQSSYLYDQMIIIILIHDNRHSISTNKFF